MNLWIVLWISKAVPSILHPTDDEGSSKCLECACEWRNSQKRGILFSILFSRIRFSVQFGDPPPHFDGTNSSVISILRSSGSILFPCFHTQSEMIPSSPGHNSRLKLKWMEKVRNEFTMSNFRH